MQGRLLRRSLPSCPCGLRCVHAWTAQCCTDVPCSAVVPCAMHASLCSLLSLDCGRMASRRSHRSSARLPAAAAAACLVDSAVRRTAGGHAAAPVMLMGSINSAEAFACVRACRLVSRSSITHVHPSTCQFCRWASTTASPAPTAPATTLGPSGRSPASAAHCYRRCCTGAGAGLSPAAGAARRPPRSLHLQRLLGALLHANSAARGSRNRDGADTCRTRWLWRLAGWVPHQCCHKARK